MRTIYLDTKDPFILGKTGESNRTALRVKVESWYQEYPDGHGVILFMRPNKVVYPLETNLIEYDGAHYLEAIVTDNETKLAGFTVVTAQWYDGETLAHGIVFSGKILTSAGNGPIDGVKETTPTWVSRLIAELATINETAATVQEAYEKMEEAVSKIDEALATAEETVAQAQDAAETAETAKTNAATSAAAAAVSATQAMSTTPEGYNAMVASLARVFDPATAYSAGEYVNYNSTIYRFTVDHAAGEWIGTDAVAVKMADDLGDLKSAFEASAAEEMSWSVAETGKRQDYRDGTLKTSADYAVTGFNDVSKYKALSFASVTSTAANTTTGAAFFAEADETTYISGVAGYEGTTALGYADRFVTVPEGAKYARFSLIAEAVDGFWLKGIANASGALEKTLELGGLKPETYITAWLQGGINLDTGGTTTSNLKLRNPGLILGSDLTRSGKATFTVAEGYKLSGVSYNSSTASTSTFAGTIFREKTGSFDAGIEAGKYYRLVVELVTGEAITPADIPTDAVKYAGVQWTDKTLTGEGRAADAQAVGGMLEALGSAVGNAAYEPTYNLILTGEVTQQGRDMAIAHRARTQYIRIQPGACYVIGMGSDDYILYNAFVYSGTSQGSVQRQIPVIGGKYLCFKAGTNENYFRMAMYYAPDMEGHVFTEEEAVTIKGLISFKTIWMPEGKRERTGTNEWFTVTVHRPTAFGGSEVNEEAQEIECILRLPATYSATGTPTRAVLACHGAEGYIDQDTEHWAGTGWDALMSALLDAGYAVFDCNVLPNEAGTGAKGYCVGSPLALDAARKAYDYVQANYNVYREIFVHGTSMGGILASAFTQAYPQLVLAESSMAGRDLSLYLYRVANGTYTDANPEFAQAWGYASVTAMKEDKWSHIVGMGPLLTLHKYVNGVMQYPPDRETDFDAWMTYFGEIQNHERTEAIGDVTAYRPVPYKTWESWGDSPKQTKAKLIMHKALRANGCLCEAVVYDTYDHDDIGFGKVEDMRNQLIAWYKRWE